MSINGQIYGINDPGVFFAQLLANSATPTNGFVPITGHNFSMTMMGRSLTTPSVSHSVSATINAADSKFEFQEFPPALGIDVVSLNLRFFGQPFYRATEFKYDRAKAGDLDIFVNQTQAVNVPASKINGALSGAGANLPGNTTLSSTPWGFSVTGSQSGVDLQFGVKLVPHFSTNLSIFMDITVNGYHVVVGFPADVCKNAHQIAQQIEQAVATEEGPVNVEAKGEILSAFQGLLSKTGIFPASDVAQWTLKLFNSLSITFSNIATDQHSWPLSNTNDNKTVMVINPVLGFPRAW